ncbi:substrate-binding periplasmic protein [Aestuariispira insulae]|nr:transporter substrate-binding domain-containing protein [Aestuariispira insulae]
MTGSLITVEASASDKPVRACTAHWPPFSIVDSKTGAVTGTHTQIVRTLFDQLGRKVEISAMPWKRCLLAIRLGKQDIVYSASHSAERAGYAYFTEKPMDMVSYVFLTLVGAKHSWDNTRNVKSIPRPIGAPVGYSINDRLREDGIQPYNKGLANDHDALKYLLSGRSLQSIVVAKRVAGDLIREEGAEGQVLILDPPYIPPKAYYIAISKLAGGHEQAAQNLLRQLNRSLE